MLARRSLIDELGSGGYEAALFTTFNAYLPFYEDVVLRRLSTAGVRHNVLIMDQLQYSMALQSEPPRFAGRRYTLLPIRVPGAFHPKLIFLAGKNKGLIAIGSHNLTLAGFGFNRELTNLLQVPGDSDPEAQLLAWQVWDAQSAIGWSWHVISFRTRSWTWRTRSRTSLPGWTSGQTAPRHRATFSRPAQAASRCGLSCEGSPAVVRVA
jgi:hypothetical protein